MPGQDDDNLREILKSAHLIRSFVKGIDAQAFVQDIMRHKAVCGQIIRMAAAARRVSEGFKNEHPMIPWENIAAMGESVLRFRERGEPHHVFAFAKKSVPELILMISGIAPRNETTR